MLWEGDIAIASAMYPPLGCRGATFGIAHDDCTGSDVPAQMQSANEEILLIAQVETAAGVENVERIAAVERIDVSWIGHFDRTSSLGIPGQFDHPAYLRAIDRVLEACQRQNKAAGFMVANVEEGRAKRAQDARGLACWGDLWIPSETLHRGITGIRQS